MLYLSSKNERFPYEICKELYEKNKKYFLPLDISFEKLLECLKGNFWACIVENQVIGFIYFEMIDENWYLSGCSERKTYKYITEAIQGLCELYFKDTDTIYSDTPFKWAQQALVRANFKRFNKNIFILRKDKNV